MVDDELVDNRNERSTESSFGRHCWLLLLWLLGVGGGGWMLQDVAMR
jgi:hypothetical protein